MDISATIIPKSDQLNSDDLIAGPLTATIERVTANEGSAEQPISVHLVGFPRPWKPCKMMRRVLVFLWGPDASKYAGRAVTIYRDPSVKWGGMEVGGIRISHLSHIERATVISLTASKGNKKPVTIQPIDAPAKSAAPTPAADLIEASRLAAMDGTEAYKTWFAARTAIEKQSLVASGVHQTNKAAAADSDAYAAAETTEEEG